MCGKEIRGIRRTISRYSITCIQRPLKGSKENGLLQQVVFRCRFYSVDLRQIIVSEQWYLKADDLLIQVVSNTGLTVLSLQGSLTRSQMISTFSNSTRDIIAFENFNRNEENDGYQNKQDRFFGAVEKDQTLIPNSF